MSDKSPESQAILDEMKPLGEWLMEHQPLNRALGRTQFVNQKRQQYLDSGNTYEQAEARAYEDLREIDAEYVEKDKRFTQLSRKYRKQRAKDEGGVLL